MNFKVGDKVRVKGAEPVGTIIIPSSEASGWVAQFITPRGFAFQLGRIRAEAFGIEIELVEPVLPEEPPIGSVVKFKTGLVARRDWSTIWVLMGQNDIYSWDKLIEDYGTDFVVLEERDKSIREVIQLLKGDESPSSFDWLAEHFGVSLDG